MGTGNLFHLQKKKKHFYDVIHSILRIFECNIDLQHTTKLRRPFQFKNIIGGGRVHPSGYAPELN